MAKKRQSQTQTRVSAFRQGTRLPNVFISWSGARSKHIATALDTWLPTVLQQAKPWLSRNIDKGTRPLQEITSALESIQVGISCLTPENLAAPWILYEGGALSKTLGEQSRLCTYLLDDLEPEDVPLPLGMFQHTRAVKDETKDMVRSLNKVIGDEPIADAVLETSFEKMWPDLAESIAKMPSADSDIPDKRSQKEMVAEILDWVRHLGFKDRWSEEKQRAADNYRVLFGPEMPNLIAVPHHGSERSIFNDDEWTKSGVVNCPRCGTPNVTVVRGGEKTCERCGATNY